MSSWDMESFRMESLFIESPCDCCCEAAKAGNCIESIQNTKPANNFLIIMKRTSPVNFLQDGRRLKMPASHRCGTLREVTRRKRGENQRGCIFWWAKASAMMRTQESADENSPKAMFHFSRAVRGTLRQREALRLRRPKRRRKLCRAALWPN